MDPRQTFAQRKYQLRFDWGLDGARRVAHDADVVVLVDALSFTTAVVVAAERGVAIAPWSSDRNGADAFAAERGATVAVERGASGFSLSPASFGAEGDPDASAGSKSGADASGAPNSGAVASAGAIPAGGASRPTPVVVLPSPNGGAIARALADGSIEREPGASAVVVLAASLRNRSAVARRILGLQEERGTRLSVAVIAAGELDESDRLRFAVEDQLAAGAVIDALVALGIDHTSPEAAVACASFEGLRRAVVHLTSASGSAVQLRELGFGDDVRPASELDASTVVPELHDGVFRA
ncbi:2-phosphosulfolactate phosphatase [Agromyces soli]